MKLSLFFGPTASGKTETILSQLEKVHRADPFSYYFVGPSGDHVRYFRENFVSRVGTINSSRFLAMDQFAVNIFRLLNPGSYHISDYIIRLEIGNVLEKMGKRELIDSTMFIDYILEMIHDVKEQGGFTEIFASDDEVVSTLIDIYRTLQERFAQNTIFDTFDAYTGIEERADEIHKGEFGRYLFIDGFHDFSPAISKFFGSVFPSFEEIFITIPDDPDREELYSEVASIRRFIEDFEKRTPDIEVSRIFLKEKHYPVKLEHFMSNLFCENKKAGLCPAVEVTAFPDLFSEVEWTARLVKKYLVDGYEPGEISLIASDFQIYDRLLSQKLREYGVPWRSEGDEPLLSSLAVKKLILPLEAAVLGFPPDKIIAMGDSGYGGEIDARFLEMAATMSRIIYDRAHVRLKLEERRASWVERLEKFIEFTSRRRDAVLSLAEDDLESTPALEMDETIRRVRENLLSAIGRIFDKLRPFESMRMRPVGEYSQMFAGWERDLAIIDSYRKLDRNDGEGELRALKEFFDRVLPELERILLFMNRPRIAPAEYYSYLMLMLRKESYPASRSIANRVEIQSLLKSRFSKRKVKIFLGFVDGAYPYVKLNPLYSFTQYSESRPKDLLLTREKQQRLNLYLSITTAGDAIHFTFPESTVEGEPILPSPYLKDILDSSGATVQKRGLIAGKRQGLIPDLKDAMSRPELDVAASKYFDGPFWPGLRERFDLQRLEASLIDFNREFSWEVRDLEKLRKHLGETFSFSRLKSYDDCPFLFFLSYVAGLDQKTDHIFELTPLDEGNVYHAVLRDYFSGRDEEWEGSLAENLTKYLLHDSNVVFKFEFARLREILQEYITIRESKRPRLMSGEYYPFDFEKGFGLNGTARVEVIPGVYLRGKIDRVDLDETSDSIYIIDYKRGNSGDKEQLILYSLAADTLFADSGYTVAGGVFKTLTGNTVNRAAFKVETINGERVWRFVGGRGEGCDWSESDALAWVRGITEGLYAGKFTPICLSQSGKCFNCRFKKMKRVATWRDGKEFADEE